MPNAHDLVQFKTGSYSGLMTLKGSNGLTRGTFYYASDARRLYLAEGNNTLADLNQFIHFVDVRSNPSAGQTSLPTTNVLDGDIYYIVEENILCTWNSAKTGDPGHWVQINPDTALATFTSTVHADNNDPSHIAHVELEVSDTANTTASASFAIAGGQNITLSTDPSTKVITISAADQSTNTQYDLAASTANGAVSINLTERVQAGETPEVDSIVLQGDPNDDIIVEASGNTITIGGVKNVSSVSNAVSTTGVFTTHLDNAAESLDVTSNGIVPTIHYGIRQTAQTDAIFVGGSTTAPTATLNIYTKDEVDELVSQQLGAANAMTYKGTVSGSNVSAKLGQAGTSDNTYDALVGDTYKVNDINGISVPAGGSSTIPAANGDLVIATGADHAVTWEVVPSGDEQLLAFTANAGSSSPSLTVSDTLIAGSDPIGGIQFVADSTTGASVITYSATATNSGHQLEVEIRHGAAGTGTAVSATSATNANGQIQEFDNALTIPVITSISKDMHGHITDITAKEYVLTDTHATLSAPTYGVSAVTGAGSNNDVNFTQVATTIGLDGTSQQQDLYMGLASDNLTISNISTTVTHGGSASMTPIVKMNLEWGSF